MSKIYIDLNDLGPFDSHGWSSGMHSAVDDIRLRLSQVVPLLRLHGISAWRGSSNLLALFEQR